MIQIIIIASHNGYVPIDWNFFFFFKNMIENQIIFAHGSWSGVEEN